MSREMKKQQEQNSFNGIEPFKRILGICTLEGVLRATGAFIDSNGDIICLNCGLSNECCKCGMEEEW